MDPIAFNLMHGRLLFRYSPAKRKVFVVHGHDHDMRDAVTRFLLELGLEAIVLDEQASRGRTIIEKFEHHSKGALLALAVLTPDDIGYPKDRPGEAKPRARQNVFFELGFFVGKLGRDKVVALCEGEIEFPSDLYGVVYIERHTGETWKIKLLQELEACGVYVPFVYQTLLRNQRTT